MLSVCGFCLVLFVLDQWLRLWNTFTILTFLYDTEFYPQHVLQFTYNVHVYTLVILSTFKISA